MSKDLLWRGASFYIFGHFWWLRLSTTNSHGLRAKVAYWGWKMCRCWEVHFKIILEGETWQTPWEMLLSRNLCQLLPLQFLGWIVGTPFVSLSLMAADMTGEGAHLYVQQTKGLQSRAKPAVLFNVKTGINGTTSQPTLACIWGTFPTQGLQDFACLI